MDIVSEFVVSCDCRRKVQSKFEKKNSFAYIHVIYSMQSYCLYIYNMAYIHIYIYIKTACRDIQTVVIKTCAYTNRYALKCAFGEEYNELYPGTIYSPHPLHIFSSTVG